MIPPRLENSPPPPDLSGVIGLALAHNDMLATKDISTIYVWLGEGCDLDLDILPAMKEVIERRPKGKSKISTFSYFSNPVRAARDKRLALAKVAETRAKPVEPKLLANAYAWKCDRGLYLDDDKLAWLEQYEKENGKVLTPPAER